MAVEEPGGGAEDSSSSPKAAVRCVRLSRFWTPNRLRIASRNTASMQGSVAPATFVASAKASGIGQ